MTNEDKKIVADYMGWKHRFIPLSPEGHAEYHRERHDGFAPYYIVAFNPNDASLVAAEMQKRGEWDGFITYMEPNTNSTDAWSRVIAWLYNAENFLKAFVEWRKTK
jgi:DNA modification methylase